MWIVVFLCVFCVAYFLFRTSIGDMRREENEWKDILDSVNIEDECDMTREKAINIEKTYEKPNNVSINENRCKKEDKIHEQGREFSLKDAIIYSSIMERPYK